MFIDGLSIDGAFELRLSFFEVTDRWLNDLQVTYFNKDAQVNDDIVTLTIQENDLARFPYRSPVDRDFLNKIVTKLDQSQVRALFIDILFDQPTEPLKDKRLYDTLRNLSKPLVIKVRTY